MEKEAIVIEDMKFYLNTGIGRVIDFNKETLECQSTSTNPEKGKEYDLNEVLEIAYILWSHRKHVTIEPIIEDR